MTLADAFLDNFSFKEPQNFAEWCGENVYLPSEAVAVPGFFDIEKTPYMKFIYKIISDGYLQGLKTNKLTLMFGAQLGKTQLGLNYMLYSQAVDPCPMMYVLPTINLGKKFSKQRLVPLIEKCLPTLNNMRREMGRASSQTMSIKRFNGGVIFMVGANSKSDLSSTPIKRLIMDEVDKYKADLDGEGNPLKMAEARTVSFGKEKMIFVFSTPSIKGFSNVEDSFNSSTKYWYYVPCPHCQKKIKLQIENLKKEGLVCGECEKLIEDKKHKTEMINNGDWRTQDEISDHLGFHLNQLYAPVSWVEWKDIYVEWKRSEKHSEDMKAFVNLSLAETYEEEGTDINVEGLDGKCILDYKMGIVPEETIALTMAIDCQVNRVEYEIKAWKQKYESHSIEFGIIPGRIKDEDTQEKLKEIIYNLRETQSGVAYKVSKVCVDSGFDSGDVYLFCKKFPKMLVVPIKGRDDFTVAVFPPRAIDLKRKGRVINRKGIILYTLGVSLLKKQVYNSLDMTADKYADPDVWRKMYFPKSYTGEFFKQLCGEKLIKEFKRGTLQYKYVWKKKRLNNEALDLSCYNLAAAYMLNLGKATLKAGAKPGKSKKEKKRPKKLIEIGE